MFHVLIDTSVGLDLAQNPKLTPLLLAVEQMKEESMLSLIVSQTVADEFHKNKARVAKTGGRSLSAHFAQVRSARPRVPWSAKSYRLSTDQRLAGEAGASTSSHTGLIC